MKMKEKAIPKQLIRVVYPIDGGKIMLRTAENWNANIEAHLVRRDGCLSEFQIETDRPYFYFKPVLIRDGATVWSRGENCLAVATSGALLEVHPVFREDTRCSACELMPPLTSPSGVEHRFRVFLPPGYHENTLKRYPVLYMHDEDNLFLKEEAFVGNTWRTDEVLNMLDKMNAIEEVIVVGIHPHDRMNEYTMPGYEDYGRFLVEKLRPVIEGKYRTLTGPTNTAAMGSSRFAVLFRFILDGNGRRCSAKWPVFRAHSRIVIICSTVFPRNQSGKFRFTSIAAGPATTTNRRAACAID